MGIGKKIKTEATLLWHSLFHGMAAADAVMTQQTGGGNGVEINQQVKGGGVLQDLLDQKETQQVVEIRDKYYRILKEADKYSVTVTGNVGEDGIDDENAMMFATAKKKTIADFMKHPPVFEEKGYTLRTIQDNKHIANNNGIIGLNETIESNYFSTGLYDYQTTLTVERGEFIPRFELDKFVTRMVVKNQDGTDRAHVDFYLPTIASQFGKIDAILIANLNRMIAEKNFRSDIVDFKTIEWYSDKAWNSDDVCLFKYDDCHPVDMCVFDGSFVITFDCHIVNDGKYLPEKFKTKELDEKYASEAPKRDGIDIFTIMRHEDKKNKVKEGIDTDNLSNTTLKLS